MSIMDLFYGFNILAGWSIYAIFDHFFLSENRRLSAEHLLGIAGIILLCSLLFDYITAYLADYLLEQFTWYGRVSKMLIPFLGLELILAFLLASNTFPRWRDHVHLRTIRRCLIVLYLIGHVAILGIRPFGYATSIIPGWHSTIVAFGNTFGALFWFILFLAAGMTDRLTMPRRKL